MVVTQMKVSDQTFIAKGLTKIETCNCLIPSGLTLKLAIWVADFSAPIEKHNALERGKVRHTPSTDYGLRKPPLGRSDQL